MTKEESEIESIAQEYFKNPSSEKYDKLQIAIYKAEFATKIFNKGFSGYSGVLDRKHLMELKHDLLISMIDSTTSKYDINCGNPFINYFSSSLKLKLKSELARIYKDEQSKEDIYAKDIYEDKRTAGQDRVVDNYQIKQIFDTIEKFYTLNDSGKENKSKSYTYMVLEYLLSLPFEEVEKNINKYTFLQPQKEIIYRLYKNSETRDISLKEYCELVGGNSTKLSTLQTQIKQYIISESKLE